jgi:hypothetical protein
MNTRVPSSSPMAGAPSRNAITSTTEPGSACVRFVPFSVVSVDDAGGDDDDDAADLDADLDGDLDLDDDFDEGDGAEDVEADEESVGAPKTAAHERMPRMRPACGPATQDCKEKAARGDKIHGKMLEVCRDVFYRHQIMILFGSDT